MGVNRTVRERVIEYIEDAAPALLTGPSLGAQRLQWIEVAAECYRRGYRAGNAARWKREKAERDDEWWARRGAGMPGDPPERGRG